MKTFEELQFEQLDFGFGTKIQAKLVLSNGITVSVVGGNHCYGDGISTFELAAWNDPDEGFIQLSEDDVVLGYLSKDEVINTINGLENDYLTA
jgi:hypothetical protein